MELVLFIYFAFSTIFTISFLYNKKENKFWVNFSWAIIYGMVIFPMSLGSAVRKIIYSIEDKK